MAKVIRSEGGRVGSIQPQHPGLHPVPMPQAPKFLLCSPHNEVGEGWEETGEMNDLFSFRGQPGSGILFSRLSGSRPRDSSPSSANDILTLAKSPHLSGLQFPHL